MRIAIPVLCLAVLLAAAAPADAATTVAVVDMVAAMQAHPHTKKIEGAWEQAQQDARDGRDKADEDLRELRRKIDALQKEDPERAELERRFEQQRIMNQFTWEWELKAAGRRFVKDLESLYRAVQAEVAAYAREQGIDMVLQRTDPMEPFHAGGPDDFALKSRLRIVVYADGPTDITDAIVKRLEKK